MRYPFSGTTCNQTGAVVLGATVSVFLAGTTTPASIYTAQSGGVAVNSVISSLTDGTFTFWVELTEQPFDIVVSKTISSNASYIPVTLHNLAPFTLAERFVDKSDTVMDADYTLVADQNVRSTLILDAGGTARSVTPSGTFSSGYETKIINVGSEDITFDPAGLAESVGAGQHRSFYMSEDGTWK